MTPFINMNGSKKNNELKAQKPWYEHAFKEDYLTIYSHRGSAEARKHIDLFDKVIPAHTGMKVLDLGCGFGRHSLELAKRRYRVVGLDLSNDLLNHAVEQNRLQAQNVQFVRADMRTIPFVNCFHAVINAFTSFGYFETDKENSRVIREIAAALQPKGWLFFDYMNANLVLNTLKPKSEIKRNGMYILQERNYNPNTKRIEKSITIRDKLGVRAYQESVRAYAYEELLAFLQEAGFSCKNVFGDYRGNSFTKKSARCIIIGQKNA